MFCLGLGDLACGPGELLRGLGFGGVLFPPGLSDLPSDNAPRFSDCIKPVGLSSSSTRFGPIGDMLSIRSVWGPAVSAKLLLRFLWNAVKLPKSVFVSGGERLR